MTEPSTSGPPGPTEAASEAERANRALVQPMEDSRLMQGVDPLPETGFKEELRRAMRLLGEKVDENRRVAGWVELDRTQNRLRIFADKASTLAFAVHEAIDEQRITIREHILPGANSSGVSSVRSSEPSLSRGFALVRDLVEWARSMADRGVKVPSSPTSVSSSADDGVNSVQTHLADIDKEWDELRARLDDAAEAARPGDAVSPESIEALRLELEPVRERLARVHEKAAAWQKEVSELAGELSRAARQGFRNGLAELGPASRRDVWLRLARDWSDLAQGLAAVGPEEGGGVLAWLYREGPRDVVLELAVRTSRDDLRPGVTLSPAFAPEGHDLKVGMALSDEEVARSELERVTGDPGALSGLLLSLVQAAEWKGPWMERWAENFQDPAFAGGAPEAFRRELASIPERISFSPRAEPPGRGASSEEEDRPTLVDYLAALRRLIPIDNTSAVRTPMSLARPIFEVATEALGEEDLAELFSVHQRRVRLGESEADSSRSDLAVTRFADWLLRVAEADVLPPNAGERLASTRALSGATELLVASLAAEARDQREEGGVNWSRVLHRHLGRNAGAEAVEAVLAGLKADGGVRVEAEDVRDLLEHAPPGSELKKLAIHELVPRMSEGSDSLLTTSPEAVDERRRAGSARP